MPSLYESTVNTGEVSSSNFTTLYNASGLAVPNAGAGSVTGNLNVGGNLTVQGNSLLIGEVTLQSTLSLPNYTFPLPDGTTDQVLVTDGNGNVYWSNVQALPGATYTIEANTATGGANLTLVSGAGPTDSVKFASGNNMSIVQTDTSTITVGTVVNPVFDGGTFGNITIAVVNDNTIATTVNDLIIGNSADTTNSVYINSSASEPVTITRNSANTAAATRVLTLKADSTGTPTTGFGGELAYEVETAVGVFKRGGGLQVYSTDVSPGSEDFSFRFSLMQNGATYISKAELDSAGNLQINGDLTVSGANINTGVTNSIIQIDRTTTNTSASARAVVLQTTSTGTPTVGFGTALGFSSQTAATTYKDAGYINVYSTDVTTGSEDFSMGFGLMQNGAAYSEKAVLDSAGNFTADGYVAGVQFIAGGVVSYDASGPFTTSTTTPNQVASTANASIYRSVKYQYQITSGTSYQAVEIMIIHDGTTAYLNTYSDVRTGANLSTFSADISGGFIRLLVTPTNAITTYKGSAIAIEV